MLSNLVIYLFKLIQVYKVILGCSQIKAVEDMLEKGKSLVAYLAKNAPSV